MDVWIAVWTPKTVKVDVAVFKTEVEALKWKQEIIEMEKTTCIDFELYRNLIGE